MNIVIPDDYQQAVKHLDCFNLLREHRVTIYNDSTGSLDELAYRFKDAEALVLIRERTHISEELLAKLPNLKLISQTGKISNHLDLDACTRHKVAVAEGVGSPIAPAELTWSLIMNASRKIPQAIKGMQQGLWQTNIGRALNGQVLGIWGYGKIGKKVATYAKAFDMKVMVWGSESSRNNALKDGLLVAESKETFFANVDILSLHLRLTESTIHIVTATDLALMKPDSIFVNTARAELLEKDALLKALKEGRPGFAALDVFDEEPVLDKNFPFFYMPNVVCTPHLGYVEQNGYELYFSKAFENVVTFANGNPMNIANPEVL
jgi:D-3-phosphoglycerate dehydrogenase